MASILTILHTVQLSARSARLENASLPDPVGTVCYSWGGDVLVVGIIANYAAVAADTFSSELGILARTQPRLITSLNLRRVPPGTNGGVTIEGLVAGLFGSMIIVTASIMVLPMCSEQTADIPGGGSPWMMDERRVFMTAMVVWGALGSVLDSVLGGLFQRTVRDTRSGKIVEGEGGHRVLVSASSGGSAKRAEAKKAIGATAKTTSAQVEETAAVETDDAAGLKARYNSQDKHRKSSFGDDQPSRVVESGRDWLDNNDVNFLMAVVMSVGAMAGAAWYWGIPANTVLKA